MADLKIQDATLAITANNTDRVPVSQGDGLAKTITVQQIVDKVDLSGLSPATHRHVGEDVGSVNSISFDTTPATIPTAIGSRYWDSDYHTTTLITSADSSIQDGQEVVQWCVNKDSVPLPNGTVVKIIVSPGAPLAVSRASADTEGNSYLLGVTTQALSHPNGEGFVTLVGRVNGLNTDAYDEGTPIFLSVTPGQWTGTKPLAPYHGNFIGTIGRKHISQGYILVNPVLGNELNELHDVLITNPLAGNILQRNVTNTLWENKTIADTGLVTIEQVQDNLGGTTGGDGFIKTADQHLTITYNDAGDALTLAVIPTVCYFPTGLEFGSAIQQYDVSGSTFVSAVAGGTLGGIPAASAGNTLTDCLNAIRYSRDGAYVRVQELAGTASATNPNTNHWLFSGITRFSAIDVRFFYSGSVSHNYSIRLWNFTTLAWDTYSTFAGQTDYVTLSIAVLSPDLYISGGVVKLEYIHISNGIATHNISYDFVALCDGGAGTGGSPTASAITYVPAGNIAATNVQTAIQELDTEKMSASTVQALGTQNTNYTVNFNLGRFVTVTTGSGVATLTIPDWASATESVDAWLYITQGATDRVQTHGAASGTNNNIISSGGLLSAGDALPSSGANTVNAFKYTWNGTKWFVTNALHDIKA